MMTRAALVATLSVFATLGATASAGKAASDDFVFGTTSYMVSGTSVSADGFTLRPVEAGEAPFLLMVDNDGAGDISLDGAWQADVGDVSKAVGVKGGFLSVELDSLEGLGLAVSFSDADSAESLEASFETLAEDGTTSSLDMELSDSAVSLALSGDAAKADACELVFFEDGAVVYEEEVACGARVKFIVKNPRPVYADIHIPSHNPHPVITTNGDEMYIFE